MAGVTPNDGETLILNLLYKNADVNRGTDLHLGLFTNNGVTALDENSSLADVTVPSTAGGYAVKTLTDATWSVSGDNATYAQQTWTATGEPFSTDIYGYYIATTGSTGVATLLHFEVEGTAVTVADGESYKVDLSSVVA